MLQPCASLALFSHSTRRWYSIEWMAFCIVPIIGTMSSCTQNRYKVVSYQEAAKREKRMVNQAQIKSHDGACGFCKSAVHPEAIICSSCGARWGTSTGDTPEIVYLAGIAKVKIGFIACALLAAFLLGTFYMESPWAILAMALGLFLAPPSLGYAIGGFISIWKSKRLLVNWWRET